MFKIISTVYIFINVYCFGHYTPRNVVEGGYTGISLSVRLSVCLSVRPSVREQNLVRRTPP